MERFEFVDKMRLMFENETPELADRWADWLEKQCVPYKSAYSSFYGIHQQYGGELANLMYITGPRRYGLHPNEFMLAAEYLYDGGTLEQIDERPSLTDKQNHSMCQSMDMSMGPGGR